jgi:arylformamidase
VRRSGKVFVFRQSPYGLTKAEYLDIFPSGSGDAAVFVFFHGGYWRAMSAEDYSFVAVGPAARRMLTVSVNYALAPRVQLDELVRHARSAVAWIRTNIRTYGGDPNRIIVGGHGSARSDVLAEWSDDYGFEPEFIRGGLLLSGLFERAPLRYSFLQPQLQLDKRTIMRNSPRNLVRKIAAPNLCRRGRDGKR